MKENDEKILRRDIDYFGNSEEEFDKTL